MIIMKECILSIWLFKCCNCN